MLKLKNVRKTYKTASEDIHALKGINLCFRQKEFVSILGPSGCGKTTLLNIIGGLDHYTSGDLVIGGKSTRLFRDRDWDVYRNHRIGFIFQSYNLIPHQTVLGNVELALTIAGVGKEERTRRAKEALARVGLAGQYYKRPNQMSGGQCQRVAIARALVNDPEILLADEPTGALDTATSVQIMNLIREIAGERLVIMVTHNPELADCYSNRIIRLLDGKVVEDTNPYSEEAEAEESHAVRLENRRARISAGRKLRKEKAKMSLFTAMRLSARNLFSKRGRTAMVGFAGSIGIIGIAMVLALSAGIKGYVASMQDDMLSGNPITITETAYDLDALSGMMNDAEKEEIVKQAGKVYIQSMIEYIAEMKGAADSLVIENDITEDYVNYLKAMPQEYYAAMLLGYGIDFGNNIYADFSAGGTSSPKAVNAIAKIYTSVLGKTDFAAYASYVTALVQSFREAPGNANYISSQYDILSGKVATEKDEVMLVLDKNSRTTDLLLANLGYYSQEEFLNIAYKAGENASYDASLYKEYFTYEELLGKTFTYYPNDTVFVKETNAMKAMLSPFAYYPDATGLSDEGAVTLKVVGILQPKEEISYGCLRAGFYYTTALTDYALEVNKTSQITEYLAAAEGQSLVSMTTPMGAYGISYKYTYTYEGENFEDTAFVGQDMSAMMMGMMSSFGSMGGTSGTSSGSSGSSGSGTGVSGYYTLSLRNVAGNPIANSISIYPVDFDSKDLVTAYLDAWNADGSVTVGDTAVARADRNDVTYTDTIALIINIINTMVDIVSYALIAFTSISLVVSTVMIGIITYVSVVERIKEIGVIRSLGGRKRDVSHLFNAETFILGFLAGAFGVGVTYLLSAAVNVVVYRLTGVRTVAALPWQQALLMVALSVFLTLISGLLPAASAARKDPVTALRTE